MKLWLLSSAIVSTACVAACGPPESGEEEFAEQSAALAAAGVCVLTDDVGDTFNCSTLVSPFASWQGVTATYTLSAKTDRDFFRFRFAPNISYHVQFETLAAPGAAPLDSRCELLNSSGIPTLFSDDFGGSASCALNLGLKSSPSVRDLTFMVTGTNKGAPMAGSTAIGAYRIRLTLTG